MQFKKVEYQMLIATANERYTIARKLSKKMKYQLQSSNHVMKQSNVDKNDH